MFRALMSFKVDWVYELNRLYLHDRPNLEVLLHLLSVNNPQALQREGDWIVTSKF